MGGSLGLALQAHQLAHTIVGYSRKAPTLQQALDLKLIDEGTTCLQTAVTDADLVVLCTPLGTYAPLTQAMAPWIGPHTIVSDVGSVKTVPTEQVLAALAPDQKPCFVPGHPIAGTEHSGPAAALPTLYQQKSVLLTPTPHTDPGALQRVRTMWEALGANVQEIDAPTHDAMYARISHVVQFACSAYMLALARTNPPLLEPLSHLTEDPNVKSFLRIAGSSPIMWQDIALSNHAPLLQAFEALITHLTLVQEALQTQQALPASLRTMWEEAHAKRRSIEQPTSARPDPSQQPHAALYPLLPSLIGASIMEPIARHMLPFATGSGLHGVTAPLLLLPPHILWEELQRHRTTLLPVLAVYIHTLHALQETCQKRDAPGLHTWLEEAQQHYLQALSFANGV